MTSVDNKQLDGRGLSHFMSLIKRDTAVTSESSGNRTLVTDNAADLPLLTLSPVVGESVQDGTPTPSAPVYVQAVRGRNLLKGDNKLAPTANTYGWMTNGNGNPDIVEKDGHACLHLQASVNTTYVPSIRTRNRINLEWNCTYTCVCYVMFDKEITTQSTTPSHFHVGSVATTDEFDLSIQSHGGGVSVTLVSPASGTTFPANTWIRTEYRITTAASAPNASYPCPAFAPFVFGAIRTTSETATVNTWMHSYMFELGSVAHDYVPYGQLAVASRKNLVTTVTNGNTSSSGITSSTTMCITNAVPVEAGDIVEFSTDTEYAQFGFNTYNSAITSKQYDSGWVTNGTYTCPGSGNLIVAMRVYKNNTQQAVTPNSFTNVFLYKKKEEHVTYLDLKGNELHGLDTTYRDTLDIDASGHAVITKRTHTLALSDIPWVKSSGGTGYYFGNIVTLPHYKFVSQVPMLCESFAYTGTVRSSPYYGSDGTVQAWYSGSSTVARELYAVDTGSANLESFLAKVAGKSIIYPLDEPYTIDLGYVSLPQVTDGSTVHVAAEVQPVIGGSWWAKAGEGAGEAVDAVSDHVGTAECPYTEVEWVESNGTQYVYLDWKPPIATWGFEADFIIRNAFNTTQAAWRSDTNASNAGAIFGTRNTSSVNDIEFLAYNSTGLLRNGTGSYTTSGLLKTDKTRQTVSYRGTSLKRGDGTTVTWARTSETTNKPYANMAVFCYHDGLRRSGTGYLLYPSTTRIYSLKFYDGDNLEVDLVGAIRNRDGMTGLYDKVKGHFYPAANMSYGGPVGTLGEPDTVETALKKRDIVLTIDNRSVSRMLRANVPYLKDLEDGQKLTVIFSTNMGNSTQTTELAGWDDTTSNSNVYLKLTLAGGKETEWIPCFYAQGTRLTTHYGSGTPVLLTYRENVLYGQTTTSAGTAVMRAFYADPNYVDGNTTFTRYSDAVIAGLNGLKRYTLCMRDVNGNWTSIVNEGNNASATGKTAYTGGLMLGNVLYQTSAAEYAAGANAGQLYESYTPDLRYSVNGVVNDASTTQLQLRKPVYLVGTVESDGYYYLDTTKWWTQDSFTTGKVYVLLGWAYGSYYYIFLAANNPAYIYDGSKLVEYRVGKFEGSLSGNATNVTGTVAIANGGTGATTAANAANAIFGGLPAWTAVPTDDTYFPRQDTAGTASYGKAKFLTVWNYIKGKISSVLGLTSTADNGVYQRQASITVKTGSTSQSHISLQTLMTWLMTTKGYIPNNVVSSVTLSVTWSYADNDILQFTANGVNYELQLAGCVIKFDGVTTAYNAGVFRLMIFSSPANSFTAASGYNKVPLNSIAVYTCNGSNYAPAWNLLVDTGNLTAGTGLTKTGFTLNHSNSVTAGTAGTSSATSGTNTLAVPYVTYDAQGHVTASGTHTHTIGNASTSAYGVTKLSSATDSTSEALAATPKAVKDALAAAKTYADGKNNQNAFSNVKVGSTTVAADTTTDTLELVAGTNVTLTPDATNDKVTIAATDTTYTAGTGLSLSGTQFSNSGVTGVKGNAESSYRTGQVNITPANVGAVAKSGDTMTGSLGIQKQTVATNTYDDANPKLSFLNVNGSQNVSLTFTDYDTVQSPASLTLNGNQGGEYFIAPNIKATGGFYGSLTGNASTATSATSAGKLTTARTINVGNYASGTATSFDGSANITIPVNSLSTAALVEPSIVKSGSKTSLPLVDTLKGNKLALLPADQIIIEKTTDGGTTWVDYGATDEQKRLLFIGNATGSNITVPLLNGVKNVNCGVRITFTAMKYNVPEGTAETGKYAYWNSSYIKSTERYCSISSLYFWVSTNSDGLSCKCEKANGNNSNTWSTVFNKDTTEAITGWSGGDFISLNGEHTFGGGTTQVGQPWNWRLTFFTRNQSGGTTLSTSNTGSAQQVNRILGYGANGWTTPNYLFGIGHLYTWDTGANAIFPKSITANSGFLKTTLNGNTMTIGSENSSYAHFKNSANVPFWFNNTITLETGKGIGLSNGNYGATFIEMTPATNTSNQGGYIDFHYNRSTEDYTTRIIEDENGRLSVYGDLRIGANTQTYIDDAGIRVNDVRNATIATNSIENAANFYFTNRGTPNSYWWSLLHIKGWTGSYNAWEIAGPAHDGDQRTTPLYVRSSSGSAWGSWRKIFDDSQTIPVANGGTGATTAAAAANSFLNALTTGSSDPVDDDYYISQYVNGGTTTTTYHRRPVSKLWNYIKGKIGSWMKNNTSKGNLGWTSSTNDVMPITSNTLAYWDGSFNSSHNSNLTYCTKGEFGTMATKNSLSASDIPSHAASATTYGAGSSSNYGHVKLSDATDSSTAAASGGTAATPKAVKAAYDLASSANTTAGNALSAATGALVLKVTYSISNSTITCAAHVYSAGSETTSDYQDSQFEWFYDIGSGWAPIGTGKTKTVTTLSAYGGNVKCNLTVS